MRVRIVRRRKVGWCEYRYLVQVRRWYGWRSVCTGFADYDSAARRMAQAVDDIVAARRPLEVIEEVLV